jgi:hypothetical protein
VETGEEEKRKDSQEYFVPWKSHLNTCAHIKYLDWN